METDDLAEAARRLGVSADQLHLVELKGVSGRMRLHAASRPAAAP